MFYTSLIYFALMAIVAIFLLNEVKSRWARWCVIPLFLASYGIGSYISWDVIGHAKPYNLLFFPPSKAELIGLRVEYGQRVYVWVLIENEPVAISLPWDSRLAENLLNADASQKQKGGKVIIDFSGDTTSGQNNGALQDGESGAGTGSDRRGGALDSANALGTISVMNEPEGRPPSKEE